MKAPKIYPAYVRIMSLFFIASLFFCSCQELEEELIDEIDEIGEVVPEPEPTPTPTVTPTPTTNNRTGGVQGPMDPISTMPYSQIATKEYTIELDRWDIPNDRRDPIKTTDNIQAAIDWALSEGYGIIRLPEGHYLIGKYGNKVYQAGIEVGSNMAFLMDKNAIIEMAPNDKWNYCAITVKNQRNVLISGGTVLGDKRDHIYTARASDGKTNHDEGHCLCVERYSANVTIENTVLQNATGDGILLVAQDIINIDAKVKNINILHNNIGKNRRQGVSVVGAENVRIEENEIHHIKGISPEFGIDIESYPYSSKNIFIRSNYFHNNVGHILNFDGVNTIVENNKMEQGNDLDQHIDAPCVFWNKSNVVFRNNSLSIRTPSRSSNWNGLVFNAYDIPHSNKTLNEIYSNTFIKCGIFMQGHENALIRENNFDYGHIAMKNMDDVKIFSNTLSYDVNNKCWAFRFKNVTGLAAGNIYNGQPVINLNLKSDVPFSGACQ